MLFSISWRNVWRSRTRSIVMVTSIILGVCAGIFVSAFYQGMADQRIQKAIQTEISHIQVHRPNFRQASDITEYMPDASSLAQKIRALPEVQGVSDRLVLSSLVASAETGTGVKLIGVHPDTERQTTNLATKIDEGTWLDVDKRNPIVVGHKLAEKLKVKLGSKVVLTLQDVHNNITSGAFRITGLFNTVDYNFDESTVFVKFSDLQRLTNMPDQAAHELAVYAKSNTEVQELKSKIASLASGDEVLTWKELSPEMSYLTESMDLFMYVFIIIILCALLFGIVNTMLMAVLERTKEIGMLMAIGMSRARIFGMIILESVMLSITGGVFGVVLGAGISKYFETHRIDLSMGEAYVDLGYDPYVYTHVEWGLLVNVTLLVLLTGVLAAIYPAFKALRNNPAEALRTE